MSGAAGRAFARAKVMMAMIAAIVNQGLQPLAQLAALQDLGLEYKSRGKGRNRWGGHKYTARIGRSSTLHAQNGARECARRRRHIGEGRYRGTPVVFPAVREDPYEPKSAFVDDYRKSAVATFNVEG